MSNDRIALAVGAHPDDVEFMMAGTLALLKRKGWDVHLFTVANGSCGTAEYDTEEIVAMRREESHEAAKVLGGTYHPGVVPDLEIFHDEETVRRATTVIRDIRPRIVLCPSLEDYMEDHMNTGRVTVTACFGRGMRNWVSEPPRPPTDQDLYLYHAQPHANRDGMRRLILPELFVDVSSVFEVKLDMLRCHRSQKNWLDTSQGMDSYLIAMQDINAQIARMSGVETCEYAEGFRRHSHIGFSAADGDPLREELAEFVTVNYDYEKMLNAGYEEL